MSGLMNTTDPAIIVLELEALIPIMATQQNNKYSEGKFLTSRPHTHYLTFSFIHSFRLGSAHLRHHLEFCE